MEIEKESLMKLRKLEAQLVSVIEKVDNEINQVDVEWLNLRSIALEKMQATQEQKSMVNNKQTKAPVQPEKIASPVKKEYIENDFKLTHLDLELNPQVIVPEIDEEFDSD